MTSRQEILYFSRATFDLPTWRNREITMEKTQNRGFRACDACYRRKIKCDLVTPQCDWCAHHDATCTFERPVRWTWKSKKPSELRDIGSQHNERVPVKDTRENPELPDYHRLLQCVDQYETSRLMQMTPVIDPDSFRQMMEHSYNLYPPHRVSNSVKACLVCFFHYFHALRYGPTRITEYKSQYEKDSKAIPSFYLQILGEPTSKEGLQALIMMALLAPLSGDGQYAVSYFSAAIQMVFELGGHIMIEHRHLRNLFWLCYTLDKGPFIYPNDPPSLIDDALCDLSLPPGYESRFCQNFVLIGPHAPSDGALFPVDLRLSILRSSIRNRLLVARNRNKPISDTMRDIRELDSELEEWRNCLPPSWKLITLSQNPLLSSIEGVSFDLFLVQLGYYWCMRTIHRANESLMALSTTHHELQGCVLSSSALCLVASRSALIRLYTSGRAFPIDAYALTVSFCFSAFQIVFENILRHPQDITATQDLKLLEAHLSVISGYSSGDMRLGDSVNETFTYVKNLTLAAQMVIEYTD